MAKGLIVCGLLAMLLGIGSYLAAGPLGQGARDELGFESGLGAVAETACSERYRVLGIELCLLGAMLLGCGFFARASRAKLRRRELKRVGTWLGFAGVLLAAFAVYFVVFAKNFRDVDALERVAHEGLQLDEVPEFLAYRTESHRSRGWILAAGGALFLPMGLFGILAAAGRGKAGRLLILASALALLIWARFLYLEPATAQELNDFLVSGGTIAQYRGLLVAAAGCLLAGLAIFAGVLLAPASKT